MHDKLLQITHLANWHDRLPRYAYVAQWVAGKRVLDLGCGTGEGSALIAEAGAAEILAIDPSSAAIAEASARYASTNLRFVARFVEDPLDAGEANPHPLLDELSSDELAAPSAFDSEVTSVRHSVLSLAATPNTEPTDPFGPSDTPHDADPAVGSNDETPSAPPPAPDAPVATDGGAEATGDVGQPSVEATALPTLEDQAPPLPSEPDASAPAEVTPVDAGSPPDEAPHDAAAAVESPTVADPSPPTSTSENPDGFDLILALNPDLPIRDPSFVRRLLAMLRPNGMIALSVRIDGSHCLSDLLAAFEPGTNPGEPVTFRDVESVRAHFATFGVLAKEVVQHGALTTRFAPADEPERPIDRVFGATREAVPRFRLFFLFPSQDTELSAFECHVPLEPLVAQLSEGISTLAQRVVGLEHRGMLTEEQLGQKESLVDDLEQELRGAEQRRRELESQVNALRGELDGLQGELTEPLAATNADDAASLARQLAAAEAVIERQHEAMQAQRLTIDALSLRLRVGAIDAPPAPVLENLGFADGEEDIERLKLSLRALRTEFAQRQEEIAQRDRELAQVGEELRRSTQEAQTRQSQVEFLQAQVRIAEQRSAALRDQLEETEQRHSSAAKASAAKLEEASAAAAQAAEQRVIAETQRATLQTQLELLAAKLASTEADCGKLRHELEIVQQVHTQATALLARFERGRRLRRLNPGE